MGSTYNPSSTYRPTHSYRYKTCVVKQSRFFHLGDNGVKEISESEYESNKIAWKNGFNLVSVVTAHELVYNPEFITAGFITANNVIVLDAFPVKLDQLQMRQKCDQERRLYSDNRVNEIRKLAVQEFSREHLLISQDSPDMDMIRGILFEVNGNKEDCINECIRRMKEKQHVEVRLMCVCVCLILFYSHVTN